MSNTAKWKLIMIIAIVGIAAALVVLVCFLVLPDSSKAPKDPQTSSGYVLAEEAAELG